MLGTLRQRLLALFLLVSLIPSLGLARGVTFYLPRSSAAPGNPETEHALAKSLEGTGEGTGRRGSAARQHAEVMALDPATRRLLDAGKIADLERRLREEARSRGLDYICLYKIGPPIERVFGARLGPRITLPEAENESLLGALEQGGLITGGEAPRQVSGVAPFGKGTMLLAGYQLDPEISKEIVALQKNLVMYRKLGVYTWISERSLWIFAALWTVVLGLVSFALGYLVSRDTARPVLELRGAMEHVSSGDLSHRVKPSGTKEVRFLGTTFNQMVEELQSSRRALVRAERLAAWREVARAVAHEIRNPLTPIQFALERLREEARRPEAPRPQVVQENADLILNEVHSLQEFVNAFSAVAQLPEPHFAPCDVGALAESVAKLYRGSSPVEFRVEITSPVPLAWADEAQIQ